MMRPALAAFIAAAVMLALTYVEHTVPDASARPLAHYIADGAHIAWLNGLLLAGVVFGMPRCWARLAFACTFVWGAAEGLQTAVAGLIGDPRVIPSQWDGWLGDMLRLPLAAVGLSAACVMFCWLWSPTDE